MRKQNGAFGIGDAGGGNIPSLSGNSFQFLCFFPQLRGVQRRPSAVILGIIRADLIVDGIAVNLSLGNLYQGVFVPRQADFLFIPLNGTV